MYTATINNKRSHKLKLNKNGIVLNEAPFTGDIISISPKNFHIINNYKSYQVELLYLNTEKKKAIMLVNGNKYSVQINDQYDDFLARLQTLPVQGNNPVENLLAPMPGLVLKILVEEGQTVKKEDGLLILEAMKMENLIKCSQPASIKSIHIKTGDPVEKNQLLMSFQ